MHEYAVVTAPDTVEISRVLPGPIERIWAYLTDSDKRGKWLASGEMELHVGGKVSLHFHNADLSPHEDHAPERYKSIENSHDSTGRIVECDPPRRLVFTWDEENAEPTEVTFELIPRGGEVLLVVTHRRLADRSAILSVAGGWHTHLDILVDNLNGDVPRPFWATHSKLEAEYAERLAR